MAREQTSEPTFVRGEELRETDGRTVETQPAVERRVTTSLDAYGPALRAEILEALQRDVGDFD